MSSAEAVDSLPAIDIGTFNRDTDGASSEGDHDALDYPDPINHGFGLVGVLEDLATDGPTAYRRLYEAWRECVSDPSNSPSRFDHTPRPRPDHHPPATDFFGRIEPMYSIERTASAVLVSIALLSTHRGRHSRNWADRRAQSNHR